MITVAAMTVVAVIARVVAARVTIGGATFLLVTLIGGVRG